MGERHLAVVRDDAALGPTPRADHDLERLVLGEALLAPEALAVVEAGLHAADFDHAAHATIFEALCAVAGRGGHPDVVALGHELRARGRLGAVGGAGFLAELTADVGTTAHVEAHVQTLVELAVARRIAQAARAIEARACDPTVRLPALVEHATGAIFAATERAATTRGAVTAGEAVEASLRAFEERAEQSGGGEVGTGFPDLDRALTGKGLHAGRLYILAARPGIGKSALAANLARHVAGSGRTVLFLSLEMTRQELGDRLLCAEARVDGQRFASNAMAQDELDRVVRAADAIYDLPLLIDDAPGQTLAQVRAKTMRQRRRAGRNGGLGLLVVDYLQLVRVPGAESREQAVAEVSRSLKELAKQFEVPVLAISAMNRDAEKRAGDKRPVLSDLRESGSIESDADLVAFLYRDELVNKNSSDHGIAEVIIRKQRNGPTTTVRLRYDAPCLRFESLADEPEGYDVGGWR